MQEKQQTWFRAYPETVYDVRIDLVAALLGHHPLAVSGAWWKILCFAALSPKRGALYITTCKPYTIPVLASLLKLSEDDAHAMLNALLEMEMLNVDENGAYLVRGWDSTQFNSDSSTERVRKYRASRLKNGLSPVIDLQTSAFVLDRDNTTCVYCGSTEGLVVEHMYPIAMGGTDDTDNLACSCRRCNTSKGGRTPEEAGFEFISEDAEARYTRYIEKMSVE
jgi:hypothetical protein